MPLILCNFLENVKAKTYNDLNIMSGHSKWSTRLGAKAPRVVDHCILRLS